MSYTRNQNLHVNDTRQESGGGFLQGVAFANHIANSVIIACKTNAGALLFLTFVCILQVVTTAPAFTVISMHAMGDFVKIVGANPTAMSVAVSIMAITVAIVIEMYTFFTAMRGQHVKSGLIAITLGVLSMLIKLDSYAFTSFFEFLCTIDFFVLFIISGFPPFVIHSTSKDLYKRTLDSLGNIDPHLQKYDQEVSRKTDNYLHP